LPILEFWLLHDGSNADSLFVALYVTELPTHFAPELAAVVAQQEVTGAHNSKKQQGTDNHQQTITATNGEDRRSPQQ
jgi:hypothetical protein